MYRLTVIKGSTSGSRSSSNNKKLIIAPVPVVVVVKISKRSFAGNDDIIKPTVYKNVFNKWESRDKKRVYYSVFPFDYNEPWPFPPVYNPDGSDRNIDPVWGLNGEAPPCSITGKPRRALGHYPWLGRPIVPLNDFYRWTHDDQIAPYPYFRTGRIDMDVNFFWSWSVLLAGTLALYWFMDQYYRKNVSYAFQRDQLCFKESICPTFWSYGPIASTFYGNPAAPIHMRMAGVPEGQWANNNAYFPMRGQAVWIKGGDEDVYGHLDYWKFDWEKDSYIHPSLRKKPKTTHEHDDHDHDHSSSGHDSHAHKKSSSH